MPRETVPNHTPGEFQMKVGWSRDQYMQVGIETPDNGSGVHHLVDFFYGSEASMERIGRDLVERLKGELGAALHLAENASTGDVETDAARGHYVHAGRQILDAVTASNGEMSTGLWWTPNRGQVNALLRLLRKARDAAFGKDE